MTKELDRLRQIVHRRMEIESEILSLHTQIKTGKLEVGKLTHTFHLREEEADSLTGFSIQGLFLGLTGKKEERLAEAQKKLRSAKLAVDQAQVDLDSLQQRLLTLEQELQDTAPEEDTYEQEITRLVSDQLPASLTSAQSQMKQITQIHTALTPAKEKTTELKELLKHAEYIFQVGDIQVDYTGRRYNNRFHTMQEHSYPSQKCLTELLTLLQQYNQHITEISSIPAIELTDAWATDPNYLTQPRFDAIELHEYYDRVYCWVQRLELDLKKIEGTLAESEKNCRQTLRQELLMLHEKMDK